MTGQPGFSEEGKTEVTLTVSGGKWIGASRVEAFPLRCETFRGRTRGRTLKAPPPASALRELPLRRQPGTLSPGDFQTSTSPFPTAAIAKMASSRSALLIGKITHARKEWEQLSSIASLKVCLR